MEPTNMPREDGEEVQISKVACDEPQDSELVAAAAESSQNEGVDLPAAPQPQTIIEASEQAWIEGTRGLQQNLMRALHTYQSGWFGWKERGLLAQKRQEMIRDVTEHYVRFLREEARITSDAAFQARRAVLLKQLLELKAAINKELADLAGVSIREIEAIFREHSAEIADEEFRKKYAQFTMDRLMDLLDTANTLK